MSESTSTLLIKLLSSGDFSALEHGKKQSEELKVSLEALKSTMELLGVGLSLGALVEGTRAMIEYGASIKHLSEQAGIATEAFQTLTYATVGAGLKQEDLSTSLNMLQRNMANAADGASKQNRAIADLGLNTAELLAMPVEQQIEAIAKAYVSATDKGRAWADVIALLGKHGARFKEVLIELGEKGLSGVDSPLKISDADLNRLDSAEKFWGKIGLQIKAIGAMVVARPGDAMMALMSGQGTMSGQALASFGVKGISSTGHGEQKSEHAEEQANSKEKIEAIKAQLEATIQAEPQMVAAHQALAKALADEGKAYETPLQAVKRLRDEGQAAFDKGAQLGANKFDAAAQLESLKLKTEAVKLWAEANVEEVKAKRQTYEFDEAEIEMAGRMAQLRTKLLPVSDQLVQARQREASIALNLATLDPVSLTYRKDHLKIEAELLAVKQEISTLEEKDATAKVEQMVKNQEMQNKREAIAIAVIEHDANLTDTQKWDEKRAILTRTVSEQERYIANMQRIANDPNAPQSARDKAGNAAGVGANALSGTQEELSAQGPNPHSFLGNFSAQITKLQNQWGTLQQNMAKGLTGSISSGFSSLTNNLSKAIVGAQTLGQAFRNVAIDIGETLVSAIVDMGVKWVATEAMKLAFGTTAKATDTATTIAAAEAASLAWAIPAMLASVASFGAADLAGAAGLSGAIAMAVGLGAAGFESGGYTGGNEGQPAGMVHGKEFVWSAPAVRAIGVGNLERAHQAALSGGGGVASAGSASGASGNIIIAMSPEDVAKAQRGYVDSRVYRTFGKMPRARYAR